MKGKKEFLILMVIIGALALYIAWRQTNQENYRLPHLSAMNRANVTRLELTGPEGAVTLSRKGGHWRVGPEGYRADPAKVRRMLKALDELTLTAMVSESHTYNRYGLGPDMQIAVKAWAGQKPVRNLLIGKVADSYRQTFVRLAGDQRVYHAEGNIRGNFDQSVAELRDRTVLAFDRAKVDGLTVEQGKRSLVLRREETAGKGDRASAGKAKGQASWKAADGKNVDAKEVGQLLSSLENLHCSAFLGKNRKELKKPLYRVSLAGKKPCTLSIFAPEGKAKGYPATSTQSESPFLLPKAKAEAIVAAVKKLGR